jgi:thiol-disulfide isomerase/thioredoxin
MKKKIIIYILVFIVGGISFIGIAFLVIKYKLKETQEQAEIEAEKDLKNSKTTFLSKPNLLFSDSISKSDLEIELKDISSLKDIKLKEKKGKLLIINNWATWCIPCVAELPYFIKLMEETKRENIEFLFVSNEDIEKLSNFKRDKNLSIPIFNIKNDIEDSSSMFFTNNIPMTLIISPEQDYYLKSTGSASWYSLELKKFITSLSKGSIN